MINSRQNAKIKLFASLRDSKAREEQKKLIIEGSHLMQEALAAAKDGLIDFVLFTNSYLKNQENRLLIKEIEKKKIPSFLTEENLFNRISDAVSPQGIAAVISQLPLVFPQDSRLEGVGLALVEIQDPGNLGAILRTANAFDVGRVFILGNSADVFSPKAVRASMGAVFKVPLSIYKDKIEGIRHLKKNQVNLVAAVARRGKDIKDIESTLPTVFLLGNEGQGLTQDIIELCSESGKIPMSDKAESLNVAAAAAVILYEAYRKRR
jgi:RNA methyltransferase, TrmH family